MVTQILDINIRFDQTLHEKKKSDPDSIKVSISKTVAQTYIECVCNKIAQFSHECTEFPRSSYPFYMVTLKT